MEEAPAWAVDDGGVREEARRQAREDAERRRRKRARAEPGPAVDGGEEDAPRWFDDEREAHLHKASWWEALDRTAGLSCCRRDAERGVAGCSGWRTGGFAPPYRSHGEMIGAIAGSVRADGVARYAPAAFIDPSGSACGRDRYKRLISRLSRGIQRLHESGMEASFILLFDELWELAEVVAAHVSTLTSGRLRLCHDMLAWRVQNGARTDAFSPHRDRQPDDIGASFFEDGSPKFITAWLALNGNATPDCSCLYCLPAGVDEGYRAGDDDATSPLDAIFGGRKEVFQVRRGSKGPWREKRARPRDARGG